MITKDEAIVLVARRLEEMSTEKLKYVIDLPKTLDMEFGWVFSYNSKEYIETRNPIHQLAGNGPIFFNKYNGEIIFGVSYKSFDEQLQEYTRRLKNE